ncbi:hypothetical protein LDENG_00244810 [Lucifuga dentata]|nr:hypothetical protein LDENG_00244810 [Lucifuga dentata]
MAPQKLPVSARHTCPPSLTLQRKEMDATMDQDDLLDQESIICGDPCISASSHRRPLPERRTLVNSTPRGLVAQPHLSAALFDEILPRNLGSVFDTVIDACDVKCDSRSASPTPSLATNSSLAGRQLCSGITKTGKVCKKRSVLGQDYCRFHEGNISSVHS